MRRTKTMLMGDLLEEFFKRPYVAAKVAEGKLPDTWRAVVGDRAADFTTELKLENHILYARIQSSVLRSELFYQREALKEELNRRSGVRIVNAVIIREISGTEGTEDTGGTRDSGNTGATANKRDKNTAGTENTGDTTKIRTHEKAGARAETETD